MSILPFLEKQFPTNISMRSSGGPQRRTEIVTLASGAEERNSRWADSRRQFNAGIGMRSIADLNIVVDFFEECRGRLCGFRWKDHTDFSSALPSSATSPLDQVIGTGDGATAQFNLSKTYGSGSNSYTRSITKPVVASVVIAVAGAVKIVEADFTVDETSGIIEFQLGSVPQAGEQITAGFEFDVPVRFDADQIDISLEAFSAGQITDIAIVEIRQ